MNAPEYDADLAEWQKEQKEVWWKRQEEIERLETIQAQESDEEWLNRWARDEADLA